MSPIIHRWYVGLIIAPGNCTMLFNHSSRVTGTQTLDSTAWPLSPDIRTERGYLSELYGGVCEFMERRA